MERMESRISLVKAYLTGKELKAVAEVDVSISDFMGGGETVFIRT